MARLIFNPSATAVGPYNQHVRPRSVTKGRQGSVSTSCACNPNSPRNCVRVSEPEMADDATITASCLQVSCQSRQTALALQRFLRSKFTKINSKISIGSDGASMAGRSATLYTLTKCPTFPTTIASDACV